MNEERVNAEINFETGSIETEKNTIYSNTGDNKGNSNTWNNNSDSNTGNVGYGNTNNFSDANSKGNIPTKVSIWTKLKGFLLQDVSEMKLELTPGEKKFVDFWTQDVTIDKVYNFLFQEVKFK